MSADSGRVERAGEHPPVDVSPRQEGKTPPASVELERWEGRAVQDWVRAWGLPALHIFARMKSTNVDARRLADLGAPSGTIVIADEQTEGKGRRGRSWHAPYGRGLLLSVILRPPPRQATLRAPTAIPIQVGVAVGRAIEAVAPVRTTLKWPNDVLIVGSGKVAGILCEGALGPSVADYVVAGIGINVNQRPAELPNDADAHASSVAIAAGRAIPRAALAGALSAELGPVIHGAGEPLNDALLEEYARRDVLRGQRIIVDDTIGGTANGITRDGGLRVDTPAGTRTLLSGTVRLATDAEPRYPGWTGRGSTARKRNSEPGTENWKPPN